jgi:hypothetical protein
MTTTTIKVHVSAADSIKNACQCGWQRIQVDFSAWNQAEREYLATCVKDDEGASLNASIAPPTAEQLRQWVTDQLDAIQRKLDEKKAQALADIEAVRVRIAELQTAPIAEFWNLDPVTGYSNERAFDALAALGFDSTRRSGGRKERLYPDQIGRGNEWTAELQRQAAEQAEKDAEREAKNAEINAAAAAREAAKQAEYDALYARLPEEMRTRDDAGYLAEGDLKSALRALIRADAKLPPCEGWQHKYTLSALTAEQYAALQDAIKAAPEGASVTPCVVYDGGGYRKATDDDDEDDVDSDGEVALPRENERTHAVIKWTRGGIECTSQMPLE